jgi:hypothetical protein
MTVPAIRWAKCRLVDVDGVEFSASVSVLRIEYSR